VLVDTSLPPKSTVNGITVVNSGSAGRQYLRASDSRDSAGGGRQGKPNKPYQCSKCGQPKKGHACVTACPAERGGGKGSNLDTSMVPVLVQEDQKGHWVRDADGKNEVWVSVSTSSSNEVATVGAKDVPVDTSTVYINLFNDTQKWIHFWAKKKYGKISNRCSRI
jgi:hypothetical protein